MRTRASAFPAKRPRLLPDLKLADQALDSGPEFNSATPGLLFQIALVHARQTSVLVCASNAKMPRSNMGLPNNRQILLSISLILACAMLTQAQSGRRSTSTPTTSPSVSGPKTLEKAPAKAPSIPMLVEVESRNPMTKLTYL